MAYQLTSATGPKDLMQKIVDFATAQGWTIDYNNANAATGTIGGQIALHSGACHIAIGEQTAAQNPIVVNNAFLATNFNDGRLYMSLSKSINPALKQFWSHPGSVITSSTDGGRLRLNDIWGPMTEVHFFGNVDSITCMIKASADRWTHFSFGNIDRLGMTVPQTGYATALYHEYWNSGASAGNNDFHTNASLVDAANNVPYNQDSDIVHFNILDNTLDTTLGFTNKATAFREQFLPWFYFTNGGYEDTGNNGGGVLLSHFFNERNQPTTGGVQLHRLPVIYNETNTAFCYLGEIPNLRLVHIDDLVTGAEFEYGSDTFQVFPLKRKGIMADAISTGYNGQANSFGVGLAVKKVI